jgi:hypothetical protein
MDGNLESFLLNIDDITCEIRLFDHKNKACSERASLIFKCCRGFNHDRDAEKENTTI